MTRLRPDWVAADLDSFANGRNGDDNLQVLLKFEDRPKGMLWASGVAADGLPQVGGLEWSQEHPNHMTFTKFGRPKTLPTRSGPVATAPVNAVSRIPAGHPEGYLEAFATVCREAAAFIWSGGQVSDTLLPTVFGGLAGMDFIRA